MSDRQGIEIDYCPTCRGVWLDRGELDKIVERSLGMSGERAQTSGSSESGGLGALAGRVLKEVGGQNRQRKYDDDDDYRRSHSGYKKKSWLKDIFD